MEKLTNATLAMEYRCEVDKPAKAGGQDCKDINNGWETLKNNILTAASKTTGCDKRKENGSLEVTEKMEGRRKWKSVNTTAVPKFDLYSYSAE